MNGFFPVNTLGTLSRLVCCNEKLSEFRSSKMSVLAVNSGFYVLFDFVTRCEVLSELLAGEPVCEIAVVQVSELGHNGKKYFTDKIVVSFIYNGGTTVCASLFVRKFFYKVLVIIVVKYLYCLRVF